PVAKSGRQIDCAGKPRAASARRGSSSIKPHETAATWGASVLAICCAASAGARERPEPCAAIKRCVCAIDHLCPAAASEIRARHRPGNPGSLPKGGRTRARAAPESVRRRDSSLRVDRKSTPELQSRENLVCRLLLEKKKKQT